MWAVVAVNPVAECHAASHRVVVIMNGRNLAIVAARHVDAIAAVLGAAFKVSHMSVWLVLLSSP